MTPSLSDAERHITNDPACRAVAFGDPHHCCTTRTTDRPIKPGEHCWRVLTPEESEAKP